MDVDRWTEENSDALLMIDHGIENYASARCILMKGLLASGLRLAGEAFERIGKGQLMIVRGKTVEELEEYGRDPRALYVDLPYLEGQGFEDTVDKLADQYLFSYPDTLKDIEEIHSRSEEELDEVDRLLVALIDSLEVPPEVFYRSVANEYLFSDLPPEPVTNLPAEWIKKDNEPFMENYREREKRYFKHRPESSGESR